MSLNRGEMNALADIQDDLRHDDPSLTASFDVLSGWRARTWWFALSVVVLGGALAVWALGFRAIGAIGLLLVLAAPIIAVLAAERTVPVAAEERRPGAAPAGRRSRRRKVLHQR